MPKKGQASWNKGLKGYHMPLRGGKSYGTIHQWIARHFGKANRCENEACSKKSNTFNWALIKGKEYAHKRENFFMLCVSCHRKYDEINRGEKSYLWKGGRPDCKNCGKKLSVYAKRSKTGLCNVCKNKTFPPWKGKKRPLFSEETRKRMSESQKKRNKPICATN